MSSTILVVGGAHIDRRGRIDGPTTMGASNPGRFLAEPGGGAFNAARALARLGHSVRLVAPRGGDEAGESVAQAARSAGIDDRPVVFLDRATPSYTAILDEEGGLVIALADMALYQMFTPKRLKSLSFRNALSGADALLCDANLPQETLEALADLATNMALPLAAIAISPAKVVRLRPVLDRLQWLFMNAAEAQALTGVAVASPELWPARLREIGLRGGVITHGSGPLIAFHGEHVVALTPPRLDMVADVTGAGDATAAGFLSACLDGLPIDQATRHAVAAALITLKTSSATAECLSPDLLKTTLPLVPSAEMLS